MSTVFLFLPLPPAYKFSLISITYFDLHWVCHGNLLSIRVSARLPLHTLPNALKT